MDKPVTENAAALDFLARRPALLIGNEWTEANSSETLPVINPANGEQISGIAAGDARDVDEAVSAASDAG